MLPPLRHPVRPHRGPTTSPAVVMSMIGEGVIETLGPATETPVAVDAMSPLFIVPGAVGVVFLIVAAVFGFPALAAWRNNEAQRQETSDGPSTSPGANDPSPVSRQYYVVRWSGAGRRVNFEGQNGTTETSLPGENAVRTETLVAAKLVSRRLTRLGLAPTTYRVREDTEGLLTLRADDPTDDTGVEGVLDRARVLDPQAVWDAQMQERAEEEADAMRDAIDDEWVRFKRQRLEVGRVLKREIDVTVIGGETGLPPCRLCNGKGVRVLYNEPPIECEWCRGTGVQPEAPM